MKATMTEDRTVRITTTTPDGTTETVERTVRLDLEDAPLIETGQESRTRTYRLERLLISFKAGKVDRFRTFGRAIKADGSTGKRREDDDFCPDGRRMWYRQRPAAPAEIMEIVEQYR